MNCVVCGHPIESGETFIGAGDGFGDKFAHRRCYKIVTYARNYTRPHMTTAELIAEATKE